MSRCRWLACLAVLSLAPDAAGAVRPEAGDAPGAGAGTVEMLLTVAPDLSSQAKAALVAEATSIWQREGVTLRWRPPGVVPAEDVPRLRVLVVHRDVAGEGRWPVGELLRSGPGATIPAPPGDAVAVISIPGARRVLAAAGVGRDGPSISERRLGVVLGRAVAHELGHYLLATTTHAPSGLMRARIDAADFSDLRAGTFFLDRQARQWMQGVVPSTHPARRFFYRHD